MIFADTTLPVPTTLLEHTSREFTFAEPHWLWLLLPLLALLFLRRRRGAAAGILHPTIRFARAHVTQPARLAGRLGPICLTLAAAALVTALARPQWEKRHEEQIVSGIDIMIACDLSGSMSLRDMTFRQKDRHGRIESVAIDRLQAAKYVISEFIDSRPNDRIGLVAFAGKAKLCSPLTLDHGILRYLIDQFYLASPQAFGQAPQAGYLEEDGTAIGTAIAAAATRLHERVETKSKVIILVTDGANNRGSISPIEAARQAAELDIKIFTIAIGKDDRISRYTAQVDAFDEATLKEIAKITGGRYYRASTGAGLAKAFDSINKLEKTDAKRRLFTSYEELFPWPVGISILLLLAGCAMLLPRSAP